MPVSAANYVVNQIRNNMAREALKAGREDDQRWDLSERPLHQRTIGAQMGASASAGIRATMQFFKKDLEKIARSAGKRGGLAGNVASTISKYGTSSVVVSQAAELSTYPFVQGYFGRGVKPSVATGPLTVSMVSAIMPGGLASLGASAIHPGLGKPIIKLNQNTIQWLKTWIKETNRRNPNAPTTEKKFTGPYPQRAEPYGQRDPRRLIQKTVRQIENRIDYLYRDDPQSASLLKAMYLSNRKYLEKDLVREFDQSGQSHVLAFSGMHASMLYLYLKGALGLLKSTGRVASRLGRSGARAIGGFTEKPADTAIQQQKNLVNQVNRLVGGSGIKLPYAKPRNMREFLVNQQYLASVDPALDTRSISGRQSQNALQQVVNRIARANPAVGRVQPLQFRTPRRATPVAAPWDRTYSTAIWQDEPDLQSYLLSVKYDKIRRNFRPLVKHMLENLPADFDPSNYDMIVPIPLHRSRQRQRGYNQAEVLAKALAKHTGIPLERDVLRRGADTGQQSKINRQYRRQNLEQAFSVRNAERVYGRRALLFDDLITSGTTADVSTRKLRQAGASGVSVFTLARSDRDYSRGVQGRRQGGGAMSDFLGISLLSGRNTPRYPYPVSPRSIQQDFQSAVQKSPALSRYGVDASDIRRVMTQSHRQMANRGVSSEVGGKIKFEQSLLRELEGRRDKALQDFERAVKYYNDSLTQNVSVHLAHTQKGKPAWIGSGTFIAPGQVLTARHVVRSHPTDSFIQPTRGFVRGLDKGLVEFPILRVLYEDMDTDIAVLETVTHAAQQAAEFGRSADLREGPIRQVGADLRVPRHEMYDPSLGAKIVSYSDYEDMLPNNSRLLRGGHLTSFPGGVGARKGMSGGGWFNARGQLIGVNSKAGPLRINTVEKQVSVGPDIDRVRKIYDFERKHGFRRAYDLEGINLLSGASLQARARALPRMPQTFAEHITLDRKTYDKIMESGFLVPPALQEGSGVFHMGYPLDRILGDDRYTFFSHGNYLRKELKRDAYGFAFDPHELVSQYGGGVGKDLWNHYLDSYHNFMQRERFPDTRRIILSKREWDQINAGDFSAQDANRGRGILQLPPTRQRAVREGLSEYMADNPPPYLRRRVWGEQASAALLSRRGQGRTAEILVPGRVPVSAAWKRIEGGQLIDNPDRRYHDQQLRLFSGLISRQEFIDRGDAHPNLFWRFVDNLENTLEHHSRDAEGSLGLYRARRDGLTPVLPPGSYIVNEGVTESLYRRGVFVYPSLRDRAVMNMGESDIVKSVLDTLGGDSSYAIRLLLGDVLDIPQEDDSFRPLMVKTEQIIKPRRIMYSEVGTLSEHLPNIFNDPDLRLLSGRQRTIEDHLSEQRSVLQAKLRDLLDTGLEVEEALAQLGEPVAPREMSLRERGDTIYDRFSRYQDVLMGSRLQFPVQEIADWIGEAMQEGRVRLAGRYDEFLERANIANRHIQEFIPKRNEAVLQAGRGKAIKQLPTYELTESEAGRARALTKAYQRRQQLIQENREARRYRSPVSEQIYDTRPLPPMDLGLEGKRTYGVELEFYSTLDRESIIDIVDKYEADVVDDDSLQALDGDELEEMVRERLKEEWDMDQEYYSDIYGDYQEYVWDREHEVHQEIESEQDKFGHEVVSRIYQGESDMLELRQMLRDIENYADPIFDSGTGLHVHVGSENLTRRNFLNLMGAFYKREHAIDLTHAEERRGDATSWARSHIRSKFGDFSGLFTEPEAFFVSSRIHHPLDVTSQEMAILHQMERVLGETRDLGEARGRIFRERITPHGERYAKMNVLGHDFETIEFRQMEGTTRGGVIEQQIRALVNFIDHFKDEPFLPGPRLDPQAVLQELGLAPRGRVPVDDPQLRLFSGTGSPIQTVSENILSQWDDAGDIFYRLVNRAEDTLNMNSIDVLASRLLLSNIENPIQRLTSFSDITRLDPELEAAARQALEGKLLSDQFYEPHNIFRQGVYAGHTLEGLDDYLYDNSVVFGENDVLRVLRGVETENKEYLERWGRSPSSLVDYSETVVRPQEILADLSVKLLENTLYEQAFHRRERGLPEGEVELLSGIQDWDRNPNIYYSPFTETALFSRPAVDRDVGNYYYLVDKIMRAGTREEVNEILGLANRVYEPRVGIRFTQGRPAFNRASQLWLDKLFRGRATVFEGQHLSDTLTREGSLVIPKRFIAEGSARDLGFDNTVPEMWQPRPGWIGAGRTLPAPGHADITYDELLDHIQTLPRASSGEQLQFGPTRPKREIPDVVAREQLKLFSGLPQYAEHVTANLQSYNQIEESGFIRPRRALAGSGGQGVIASLDVLAGDDMFSFFSYGPRYRGGPGDDEFGKFGYVFRPETLLEKYDAQVAEQDLLTGYLADFIESLSIADPYNDALIYDDMYFIDAAQDIVQRLGSEQYTTFLQEFENLVNQRKMQARHRGGYGLNTLRAISPGDPYFDNVEIVVPEDVPISEAVGRIWHGNLQLFSGRSNRESAKDLLDSILGGTAESSRPTARTFGDPLDTLNPETVGSRITALRNEFLLDAIMSGTDTDPFGIEFDINILEQQLDNLNQLERSIVRLEGIGAEGKRVSIGSAFSTEAGTLLTNAHVLMGRLERPVQSIIGQVLGGTGERFPVGQVLGFDPLSDLAKVAIPEGVSSVRPLRFSDKNYFGDLESLEPLLSLGGSYDLDTKRYIEPYRPGHLEGVSLLGDNRIGTLGMQTLLQAGMSGGPTLDTNLDVVGVNVSTDQLRSYAVGLGTVEDFLEDIEVQGGRVFDRLTNISDLFNEANYEIIDRLTRSRSQDFELLSGLSGAAQKLLDLLSDPWEDFTAEVESEARRPKVDVPEPQLSLPPPRTVSRMQAEAATLMEGIDDFIALGGVVSDEQVKKLFSDYPNVRSMFGDYRIDESTALSAGREILERGIDPEIFDMALTKFLEYDSKKPMGSFGYGFERQGLTQLTFDFDENNFLNRFVRFLDSFNVPDDVEDIFSEFDLAVDRYSMDYIVPESVLGHADWLADADTYTMFSVGTGTEYLFRNESDFWGDPEITTNYIKQIEGAIDGYYSRRPRKLYFTENDVVAEFRNIDATPGESDTYFHRMRLEDLISDAAEAGESNPFDRLLDSIADEANRRGITTLGLIPPKTPFERLESDVPQTTPEEIAAFERGFEQVKDIFGNITQRIREVHEGGLLPSFEHVKDPKIREFYEKGLPRWDEAIDTDTLQMLQRIDEFNRDPNVFVRVTVPEDDATRSSMDDFPKHWEVAAARVLDTAETYEQAQSILGEYGRVFDPESSQVKFAPQGGQPILYQTQEGLVPHPWETAGGRPRIAAASTVDELVKQLPQDFDLESRPTLLFIRGEKALHGWMEDGFAVVADEIVERFPSELMSHFKDRLQAGGVSTYKSGIMRYGRTGEFYQKMGSLFAEYEERLGAVSGPDDYYEMGNIRERLLERLEKGIAMAEQGSPPGYRERTIGYFEKIPESYYPRLDFFTGPGQLRLGGVVRDFAQETQGWTDVLSLDPEDYIDIDSAIEFVQEKLYFDVEASKQQLDRYRRAEERGFYYSPDKLTPEDPEYWQDWNVERVLGEDFDKAAAQYAQIGLGDIYDRTNPASVWNLMGRAQKRSLLFLLDSMADTKPGTLNRTGILSHASDTIMTSGELGGVIVEKMLERVFNQSAALRDLTHLVYTEAMQRGFDEAQYIVPWEQAEIPSRFVVPEGDTTPTAPMIGESAKALARFGYIRDLGVREHYATTGADDLSWLPSHVSPEDREIYKKFDEWARDPSVFFRLTTPEDDLQRGLSRDAMSESVAHLVTHLGHDVEGLTREAATQYLSEMGGRVYGYEGHYGLTTAPGYMYSTGTPEELYQATGGSGWAEELVVFRGQQHPYGIAPHSTIARATEIIDRLPAELVDVYSRKISDVSFPRTHRGSSFSATSQSDLGQIFSQIDRQQKQGAAGAVQRFLDFVTGDIDPSQRTSYTRDYMDALETLLEDEPALKLFSGRADSPDDTIKGLLDQRDTLALEMLELAGRDMEISARTFSGKEKVLSTPYREIRDLDSEFRGFLPKLVQNSQRYIDAFDQYTNLGDQINRISESVYREPFVIDQDIDHREFQQFLDRNQQTRAYILDALELSELAIDTDEKRLAAVGQEIDFEFVGDTLRLVRDVERERDDARKRYDQRFLADAEHVVNLFESSQSRKGFESIAKSGVMRPGGSEGELVFFSQGAAYRQGLDYPIMGQRPSYGFIFDGLRMVQDEAVGVRNLVETGWSFDRTPEILFGERGLDVFRNYLRERPDTLKEMDRVVELISRGEFYDMDKYLKGIYQQGEVFVKPEYLGEDTSLQLLSGRGRGVSQLAYHQGTLDSSKWVGSGVMLEPGLAVTNAHVVFGTEHTDMPSTIEAFVAGRAGQERFQYPIEAMNLQSDRDLAFLRLGEHPSQVGVPFADMSEIVEGTPLTVSGAQGGGRMNQVLSRKLIERVGDQLVLAGQIFPGMSGGDIQTATGELVGINFGSYTDPDNRYRYPEIGGGITAETVQNIMGDPRFEQGFEPFKEFMTSAFRDYWYTDVYQDVDEHLNELDRHLQTRLLESDPRIAREGYRPSPTDFWQYPIDEYDIEGLGLNVEDWTDVIDEMSGEWGEFVNARMRGILSRSGQRQHGLRLLSGRAGTPIDNRDIEDYSDADTAFYEEYDPRIFEHQPFEGAEKYAPAGEASPFDFTEAQKAAIGHGTGRGLVIAGPGAGKTSVIRERIFNLVQRQGVDANRILTLAFNRAAADELFERSKDIGDVQVRTVHSFARQIVNDNLEALGYTRRPKIVEQKDQFEPFVRRLLKDASESGFVNERQLREIVSEVDIARANVTEGLFDPSELKGEARRFATAYETFKATERLIDFQDLLIQAADLLERRPEIRSRYQGQFDFIQVDEFQDVSESDFRFLKQLGENLFAVGDDDQTIYSFRSGAGSVMQDFAETAKLYEVTENFRSTPEIVKLGSELMRGTRAKRLPKNLTSTRESGVMPRYTETTPDTLIEQLGKELIPGRENVILVRTGYEKSALWNQLPTELQERVSDIRTIHSAKGLEFERVLVLLNTLERGGGLYRSFPSVQDFDDLDALEEERRLLYVAITRAKDEAVILGKESHFLPELGLTPPEAPPDVEQPAQELVKESRGIRKYFSDAFHRFRAHYQRVRAYQDMVALERKLPGVEIIENLTDAQVHREKIEELGKQLGLDPTARDRRPRRLGFLDSLLTLPARPGLVAGAGYAGVAPTSHFGLIGGLDPVTQTLFNLSPLGIIKGLRHIDERLYPHARRPYQQFDIYRPLHSPLPDAVRGVLPQGVDPRDYRVIESNLNDYLTTLYEFPHPEQGWEGDAAQRPLYNWRGLEMERITQELADDLAEQGLLGEQHTFIDTSQSSRNVRVTPYDPFGGDPYFRPRRPRPAAELSKAAIEHLDQMREYLEASRTSARRPRGWSPRMFDFRRGWDWQHRRLQRPVERFLEQNRGRDIVDFQGLSRLLNRLNRAHSRVSMGSPYGSHDIGGRNVQLHNEVMDLLEDVWNPESPYYNPAYWTVARGRLHDLPDGLGQATGDPDSIQRGVSRAGGGGLRRFGDALRGLGRSRSQQRMSSAFIRFTDQAGQVQNVASGVFLGEGYVGTVMHSLTDMLDKGIDFSGGTVESLGRGRRSFEITGLRAYDPSTELAIFKVAGDTSGLEAQLGQAGQVGQRLQAMGIANIKEDLDGLATSFHVDEDYATRGTLTGVTDDVLTIEGRGFRPGQSGSPLYDALGRVVGLFGGGVTQGRRGVGFGAPSGQLQTLLEHARALEETGAPLHRLEDIAQLGLPGSEDIMQSYFERADELGLGRRSLEDIVTPFDQLSMLGGEFIRPVVDQDELLRLEQNERQRVISDLESDFEELTEGLSRKRLPYSLEDVADIRRYRAERLMKSQSERRQQQIASARATTAFRPGALTGQQLELGLEGGQDLRRATGRDRLFRVMQWLDTEGIEGRALGFGLQDVDLQGTQRFFRDFDMAPRIFGATPEVPVDASVQQFLELTAGGDLATPVDRPTFTPAYELGADIRQMIETGTLRQRVFGRGVVGGADAVSGIAGFTGRVSDIAGRAWRSPLGRIGRGVFRKAIVPLELVDILEKVDYWSGDALRRLHEPQIAVGKHAAETRERFRQEFADRPELLQIIESGEIPDWVSPDDRPYLEDAQATYMESMEGVAQAHAGLMKRRETLLGERAFWQDRQSIGGPLVALRLGRSPLEREALPFWEGSAFDWTGIGAALRVLDVFEKLPGARLGRAIADPQSVSHLQDVDRQLAEIDEVLGLEGLADIGMTDEQRDNRIRALERDIQSAKVAKDAIQQRAEQFQVPVAPTGGFAPPIQIDRMAESQARALEIDQKIVEVELKLSGYRAIFESPAYQEQFRKLSERTRDDDYYLRAIGGAAPGLLPDMPEDFDVGLGSKIRAAELTIEELRRERANLPTVRVENLDQQIRASQEELHRLRLFKALEQRMTGAGIAPIEFEQPGVSLIGSGMDQVLGANIQRPSEAWLPIAPYDTSPGAFRAIEAMATIPDEGESASDIAARIVEQDGVVSVPPLTESARKGFYFRTPDWQQPYLTITGEENVVDGDTIKGIINAFGEQQWGSIRIGPSLDTPELHPERGKDAEFRTKADLEREAERGRQAKAAFQELVREAIIRSQEMGLVGEDGKVHIPLTGYTGFTGPYGRPIADILLSHDIMGDVPYEDYAKSAGIGAAYPHGMSFGMPYDTYLAQFTSSERKGAREFFEKYHEDVEELQREAELDQFMEPVRDVQGRFAQMIDPHTEGYVGFSESGLVGIQTEIEGKIQASLENIQGLHVKIAMYRQQMADMLAKQGVDTPEDPLLQGIFEGRQESIEALEEQIKAEEDAVKAYQKVLSQSGRTLSQLRKDLHKAEIDMIKAREAQVLQEAQEQATELKSVLTGQSQARKLLTARLAGDPEYVKSVEGANIAALEELESGARTEYEKYSEQYDKQSGVVDAALQRMVEAGETFQEEQTGEAGQAYEAAKVEYEAEATKLAHLRRLRGIWEQQQTAAEKGAEASEKAIEASEEYAHKEGLKKRVEGAGEDSEYVQNFLRAMGESQEDVVDQGLIGRGAPMQDAYTRLENYQQWFDTFDDRFDSVQSRLQQQIADETATVAELEDTLEPQYAERERLEEAIKTAVDPDEKAKLLDELGVLEGSIARDEASLKVSEGILEAYLKDAERFDNLLEQVEGKLEKLEEDVQKREEDIGTRAEANEQKYFEKFTGRQQSLIDKNKFDPGYDMFVRSIPEDERTPEQQAYIERQDTEYSGKLSEYVMKEGEKDKKEEQRRARYSERQQLRQQERMLTRVFTPLVSLPGDYYSAWRKQGDIEERGEERISDINERLAQDIQDVYDNDELSIRQRTQRIEELEKQAARRRIEIEEDVAEAKEEIWDGVLESFGETLAEMAIKEAEMAAAGWLVDQGLGLLGWEDDGYGGRRRKGSGGGGAADFVTVAKTLLDMGGDEQGVDQGGQSSGFWDKAGSWLGIGSAAKKVGEVSGGAWDWVTGLFEGAEVAQTAANTGSGSSSGLGPTLPDFGPAKQYMSNTSAVEPSFWDSFLGQSVSGAGAAITGSYLFGEAVRDRGSIEEMQGENTNPFLNVVGDASGQAWEGIKGVPGFAQELGGGIVDLAKEFGGFVADIPGTLNRTSGTGNWFTQTAHDVGGFFEDTFGKDSWRSVSDLFGSFGFDNAWNDEIAYRAGMRHAQQVQLSSAAQQMGHQSAMDLLAQHNQGFEDEANDMVQNRRSTSQGMAGIQGQGEMAMVVVNVYTDENGRQKRKEQQRQIVRLQKQKVVE